MAVRHGYGKIAGTDALVFAYDTGDTRNSYRGEPTTNIVAGTNAIYTVAGTYTTNTTVDGVRILENNQVDNSHVMWNGATGFIVTCSAGAYITVSAEYKTNCTIRMRFRDNPYDSQFDIDGGNINTISETSTDIPDTQGEWKRYSLTAQTSTANPDLWWYLVDYRPNNEFGRVEIRNWQIEVKSHATPFVNGTRSATQGLLDLTGNSSIDLSNVSFDSNAQMTFDGTDDYIQSTEYTVPATGPFTVEFVYRRSTAGGRGGLFERNPNSPYNGMSLGQGGTDNWAFNVSDTFNGTLLTADFTYPTQNVWYHDVGVFNGSNTVQSYRNGVLVDTTTGGTVGNLDTQGTRDKLLIMKRDNNGSTVGGDVGVTKIYNRALTADEIRNNYRHYKTRFNI